jgi:putative endonuclease
MSSEAPFQTHYCYIIHSDSLDRYYIGQTDDFANRILMHNSGFSPYTSSANDWQPFLLIPCRDKSISTRIERHIKAMKSRAFIENLARYPELVAKLIERFSGS